MDGSRGIAVHNCEIYDIDGGNSLNSEDNVGAVKLDGCRECQVTHNRLHQVRVDGLADAVNAAGIHSYDMAFSTIRNNEIFDAYNGVFHKRWTGEIGAHVFDNLIHNTAIGVLYSVGGFGDPPHIDPLVTGNVIRDVGVGVSATTHETNLESFGLTLSGNVLAGAEGIRMRGMTDVRFVNLLLDNSQSHLVLIADDFRPVRIDRSDYNVFAGGFRVVTDRFGASEKTYTNLSEWQAATGQDSHSRNPASAGLGSAEPLQGWLALNSAARKAGEGGVDIGAHPLQERTLGPGPVRARLQDAPMLVLDTSGTGDGGGGKGNGNGNGKDKDGDGGGGGSTRNKTPEAVISVSCAYLSCEFDASESFDRDGQIISYFWQFGDAFTSSDPQVNHTYGRQGSYDVSLRVVDDGGAEGRALRTVIVGDNSGIFLAATGRKVRGAQHADLNWSGSTTATVTILRDGQAVAEITDTGSFTDAIGAKGGGFNEYQVCESDGGACSNTAYVSF